jgi:hypothetical protein
MDSEQQGTGDHPGADQEFNLQEALGRLEAQDTITPDDLESFREALPTDPQAARAVEIALPSPWSDILEYVEGSDRQAAYWRTTQNRSAPRSPADREHKEHFASAARETEDVEGTVEHDGKTIPASAAQIAEEVSSDQAATKRSSGFGERALEKLRDLLDQANR